MSCTSASTSEPDFPERGQIYFRCAGPKPAGRIDLSLFFAARLLYKGYAPLITKQQYQPPGFAAPLGLKDVRLALTAGESLKVPLPLGSLVRDKFLALLARGGEGDDIAALGKIAAEQAGM